MNNEKSSRAKLIVSIASLSVAVLSLLIAVFAVYAVSSQNATTQFSVSYSVEDNIAVQVNASYQIENKSVVNVGEIVFNAQSSQNSGTLTVEDPIELTTETAEQPTSHKYVEFYYTFTNLTDTQTVTINATWETFTTDVVYLNVYVDNVLVTNFNTSSIATGFDLAPLEAKTVTIKFEVFSTSADASMKSNTETGLKWNMELKT